jgi:hypothetical protein
MSEQLLKGNVAIAEAAGRAGRDSGYSLQCVSYAR